MKKDGEESLDIMKRDVEEKRERIKKECTI